MPSSYDYRAAVKPFAVAAFDPLHQPPTPWKLDPFLLARSLLRLLDNPDAIDQACFGTCGHVAFLRAWAYRDPVAVAKFAIELYRSGSAKIGDYPVGASAQHLQSTWMQQPATPDPDVYDAGLWGVGNRITEAVWMVVGALASTEHATGEHLTLGYKLPPMPVEEFNGQPASNLTTLTLPNELKRWLVKTGCYSSVDDSTDVVMGKTLGGDSVITNPFDSSVDVFLCVHHNIFSHATFSPARSPMGADWGPLALFPDHWIMLRAPITSNGSIVTMNVWTWGGVYDVQLPLQDFDDNYFGCVVARAPTLRRSVSRPPVTGAIVKPRIYYTQDNALHFEWQRGNANVEWYELTRPTLPGVITPDGVKSIPRQVLARVWAADGPSDFHVVLPMPDPGAPHDALFSISGCRGDLRPDGTDPASYNHYEAVPANLPIIEYEHSPATTALVRTQTTHASFSYYGYPCARAIPDPLDPRSTVATPRSDFTLQYGGETIGRCRADGGVDVVVNGATIAVGTDPRTPLSVQKIAVWVEYFCQVLRNAPTALACIQSGRRIDVVIDDRLTVNVSPDSLLVGLEIRANDGELPVLCFQRLLLLEQYFGGRPEWVTPSYVSRVAVVQTPSLSATPSAFADFGTALQPCEIKRVYDAHWVDWGTSRWLNRAVTAPVNPLRPCCVFIAFARPMIASTVKLTLTGKSADGQNVSTPVPLTASADGSYYYGTCQPANTSAVDCKLTLSIDGTRAWSSSVLKALLDDKLDSKPSTFAAIRTLTVVSFEILLYERGPDSNHQLTIAPQSSYARVATLTPDALGHNDSAQSAKTVTLYVPEAPHELDSLPHDERPFDQLVFHDQQDCDWFDVQWQCPTYDDTDAANRPASGTSGKNAWGISYGHTPPRLSCVISPQDYCCVDVDVYKYPGPNLYKSEAKSAGIVIASPARVLGTKRCYFVLKNHDYAALGAFRYSVRFIYTSAFDTISVDTNAPAYNQGRLSVQRKILEKLYERIDQPRPPEDERQVIHVTDPVSFLDGFSKFLLDPETAAWAGRSMQRNGGLVVADGLHTLGELAQNLGQVERAGALFRRGADIRRALRDNAGALLELENIAGIYKGAGAKTELKIVLKEISEVKKRTAPVG